jgi:lipoprotein-anchoring transpeptidase ErfK/SrfK
MRKGAVIAAGMAAGAAAGALVVAIAAGAGEEGSRPAPRASPPVERHVAALAIPAPRTLGREPELTRWGHLRRAVVARARPRRGARTVARVARRTPEGTVTAVPVTARRRGPGGRLWLRIELPVLPNGTRGWVPRGALGAYEVSRHRLVVDLARRRLVLRRRGRVLLRAPVGIGRAPWPTPRGTFIVRNRLERFSSPRYGPVAFGTSARSPTLTDWPAGGFIGIHGTDRPDLLPGRVSHGCVRLRNPDILRLARLMPVGTPVEIR